MPRLGITYQDVANAAQELIAQNLNPTIEGIRKITNTGSNGTIAAHLRRWKATQEEAHKIATKENLPEEFISLMKGLWERLLNQAEEKVTVIQQDFEQITIGLEEQVKKLQDDNTQWQQQYHQMKQERDGLAYDKSRLEQTIRQLEDNTIALTATQEKITQQLQEKQIRIEELHRLNQQTQSNLEHYHEASREQRTIDQQRHEQIQTQLEQTIQKLQQELTILTQQKNTLHQEFQHLSYVKETLQKQCDHHAAQYETTQLRLIKTEKELAQQSHAHQHWQLEYQKVQTKLEEQGSNLIELHTKYAVLTEKLLVAENKLKELTETNEHLTHEKWLLGQEKAQLIGQLKQFEKVEV